MNLLEKKMVDALIDLKENHHVLSIKAEFEAEGTRLEEAMRLKEVSDKAGLELSIKIGGCEAIKDMYDARIIGVNTIIAPMIETPYALKKYVNASNFVFPQDEKKDIKFLVNIETETGFSNLSSMIETKEFESIDGIVLGRVDMAGSMNMSRDSLNSDKILELAKVMSLKMQKINKDMVIGGGISAQALPFLKQVPHLSRYETRKIIFNAKPSLKDNKADIGILKAVGFELMWLKNKRDFYGIIYKEDELRIEMLENRYKTLIEEAGGKYE